MHRNQRLGFQLNERAHRLFRIHVHFAAGRCVVSANRQKRSIDVVMFTDLAEPGEKCGVAAMQDRSTLDFHGETTETAVEISQKSRAPMVTRSERHFDWPKLNSLPIIELVHDLKTEV